MNATPAFSNHSTSLLNQIKTQIKETGAIYFRDYMATALYHPELGYYSGKNKRVGTKGDFITNISIGSCFGMLLARRLHAFWLDTAKSSPSPFYIIEPGANDASLAFDILSHLKQLFPDFYRVVHYHLVETTPASLSAQQKRLSPSFEGKFSTHLNFNKLKNLHGAIISNELIDAFPVDLISFQDKKWNLLTVGLDDNDHLTFIPQPLSSLDKKEPQLKQFCLSLGNHFPDGYTTEYNPHITPFLRDASEALSSGLFITIDYGFIAEDLYHPNRTEGTLQTYHRHQKSDNPLLTPGEIDITTHINFTQLIETAKKNGFTHPQLKSQASYLTEIARNWLLDIENSETPTHSDSPQLLRQFQSLIHPAMLGNKFLVLEMTK